MVRVRDCFLPCGADAEDLGVSMRRWRASLVQWIPLLMLVPVVAAYTNAFKGMFVFDDALRLVRNTELSNLWTCMLGSSRPLTVLTFALNARLTGVSPEAFRVVNLGLHMLAGWLLYGWLRRSLALPAFKDRFADEPSRSWVAAAAATLWLVHPLQTESVTYVVQRAEVLMGLFYVLTLYALTVGATARIGHRWYTVSVVACALGMVSKPVMVTAPMMILLFDRTVLSASWREVWRRRRSYHTALAATWLIPLALLSVPNESASSVGPGSGAASPLAYLATQQGVVLHYLRLAVWPDVLCLDYGWPAATGWAAIVGPGTVVVLLVGIACWGVWKRNPWGYPAFWFFAVLAPTSTIISISDFAVEHRLYLPLAGICILVAGGTAVAARRLGPRRGFCIWGAVMLVLMGTLAIRTRARNEDYTSRERMYRSILTARPDHLRAGVGLTKALLADERIGEAEVTVRAMVARAERGLREGGPRFETSATRATGYYPVFKTQLGRVLLLQGRYDEALDELDVALTWRPDDATIWKEKALTFHAMGRRQDALAAARHAIKLAPRYADPRALMAYVLSEDRRWAEAVVGYRGLLRVSPRHAFGRLELAWLLSTAPDAAVRDGETAVGLAASVCDDTGGYSAAAWDALGAARAQLGDVAGAVECARRGLELAAAHEGESSDASRPGDAEGLRLRLGLYGAGEAYRQEPKKEPASDKAEAGL